MALYSEKVMDHFRNPRNVGVIEDADGVGEAGNAVCGDIMKIYLKIEDSTVADVRFETFGCGSAIASSSMATELIKGRPLSEVLTLTNKAVAEALDGPPTSCTAPSWRRRPSGPLCRTTTTGKSFRNNKNTQTENFLVPAWVFFLSSGGSGPRQLTAYYRRGCGRGCSTGGGTPRPTWRCSSGSRRPPAR